MNELQVKNGVDLTAPLSKKELSPYDPSYPINLLTNGMKTGIVEAESAAKEVYKAVTKVAPIGTQLAQVKKETRYIVDMTSKTLEGIESGKIKLTTNKKGETFAQLLGENGKFGKKLPIKKEDITVGLDPVTIAMAMQMKAMQDQLENIAEQLDQIDKNVKEVIQGQQNDRIANYYTGAALYFEAQSIENKEMRDALIAQSLKTLTDASFQLRLKMQSDIQYLLNGEYKDAKGKRAKLIDERMNSINQGFAYIHQAALLKAGIYCNEKEYGAMSTVLDEYSYFIDKNIKSNANFLAQCDASDDGTYRGAWESRAQLRLDTSEIRKQLSSDEKILYLSCEED